MNSPAASSADRSDWFEDNRKNWDDRAALHHASGYGVQQLIDDPDAISGTLAPDVPRLGDLKDKDVIHLQCHLGTDTVSLSRLGPRRVVGVDLSGESLRRAREIASACGVDVEYVEANVYDAREEHHRCLIATGMMTRSVSANTGDEGRGLGPSTFVPWSQIT